MKLLAKCIEKGSWRSWFMNSGDFICTVWRMLLNPVYLPLLLVMLVYSEYSRGNEKVSIINESKLPSNCALGKPLVSEPKITSFGRDTIKIEADIITNGGEVITERGIIYSLASDDNQEYKRVAGGSGTGTFNILLTGLLQNKVYSVKAYAINNEGVSYGPEKKFDTFALPIFTTLLTPEVNYDTEYFSIIKTEPVANQKTKISAINKPEWLTLSSEPLARIFAGSGNVGWSNGKGSTAAFSAPYALASNSLGSIFVADQVDNRIRKISPEGEVSTVAGIISSGFEDGRGIEARFDTPSGIAVDQQGYLYISDQNNHSIRKISPLGDVITFAGSKNAGAVDGRGSDARFKSPAGICIDHRGFIYLADRGNNLIRVISPEGIVSTLAGSGKAGFADGKGKMAKFNGPTGIAVDSLGFIYVADQINNRIRKISPAGDVSTLAGNGEFSIRDGDGNQAAFRYPTALVFDWEENLYVADQLNHSIRKISSTGIVSTIKVNSLTNLNSEQTASNFKNPSGICFNKDGNILLADYHNHNIKEIIENTTLYGTPSKSQVGSHQIILKATNNVGSRIQQSELVVKDNLSPRIVSTGPADLAVDVDCMIKMIISFDEEVSPGDSGSIRIYRENELIGKYNISEAVESKQIVLSEDKKSLVLNVKDLPAGSRLNVQIDDGIVKDIANNLFQKTATSFASWSFTTKPKKQQSLALMPFSEKTYGDPVFKLGPLYTSEGLPITYYAEDPGLLFISGDSARVLKAGNTNVIIAQNGDNYHLPLKVVQALVIRPRSITIKPQSGQIISYGNMQPEIKFDISSGTIVNGDNFTGALSKAKGDSIGLYAITMGSLSLGNNYQLKMEAEKITLQKATLLIRVNDQSKIAGTPNPIFTCSYEGFVNGDSPANLIKQPVLSSVATGASFIGSYTINVSGAVAKNYNITYQSGTLRVLPTGEADFETQFTELLENMPSGAKAALLKQKKQSTQSLVFTLAEGEGDTDNHLFKVIGTSIVTAVPLDYELKHQFSIRVKSAGAFGESVEKILNPVLINVNESPQMMKIPLDAICSEGTIQLSGITAGPESAQSVKVFAKAIGMGTRKYFDITQPVNGISQLSYNIPYKQVKSLNLQIILKDDGGVLNGGIDSIVYNYTFKIIHKTPVNITSEKGHNLLRGTYSILSTNAKGKIQWYFNKQKLQGEQSDFLKIKVVESGVYSVQVITEGGCTLEAQINISVVDTISVSCTNLITPNGDGINDAFIARNIENFPGNELWILDRTGKLLYNQKCYDNSWQGTSNGLRLPNGTYYYILDLGNKKDRLMGYISVNYEP